MTATAESAALKWVTDNPPGLDPICGDEGYPTEIELQRIKHWNDDDKLTRGSLIGLMEYTRARWKYADMGYWQQELDKDGTVFYSISTGGWSGNEELMAAIHESMVWFICFESHFRGGHYTFTIKPWKETDATTQSADA